MTDRPRTGLPHVDPLIDAADAEYDRFNDLVAVSRAEGVVAAARQDDLVAEQAAAGRRVTAARGLLTRAQRNGDAEKIAAARKRLDAAVAEFNRISRAALAELGQISTGRHDSAGELFDQMRRAWDAVLDALRQPLPTMPPAGEATP